MSRNVKEAVDVENFESSSDKENDDYKKSLPVRIVTGRVPFGDASAAFPEASEVSIVDNMANWQNGPTNGLLVDDLNVLSERQEHKDEIAAMEESANAKLAELKAFTKDQSALVHNAIAEMQDKREEKNANHEEKIANLTKEMANFAQEMANLAKNHNIQVADLKAKIENQEETIAELATKVASLEDRPRTMDV